MLTRRSFVPIRALVDHADADIQDLMRPRARGPAGLLFVVLTAVALVVLAGSVFTIKVNTTDLTDDARAVNVADATIQAAIAARADVLAAVSGSSVDAESSLAALEARLVELVAAGGQLESTTDPRVRLYVELGRSAIEAVDADAGARALAELELTQADLLFELNGVRSELVDHVEQRRERIDRLATTALVVAAIVIPTAGVFMFDQVTRRRREAVQLAHDLSATREAVDRRGELLELSARRVATTLDSAAEIDAHAERGWADARPAVLSACQQLGDLEVMARSGGSGLIHQFAPVPVLDVLDRAREELSIESLELTAVSRDQLIWADPETTAHAIQSLLRVALDSGPDRLVATTGTDSQSVHCLITYDGEVMDPHLVHLLFEERIADNIWESLDDPDAFRLVVARTLLETAGARVMYRAKRGANQFHLRFPAPPSRHLPDPPVGMEAEAPGEPASV